jgi:hypothetical protein
MKSEIKCMLIYSRPRIPNWIEHSLNKRYLASYFYLFSILLFHTCTVTSITTIPQYGPFVEKRK